MLKFAKVAANTALVAEIRELLTGSAQSATRAGKKNDPFFYVNTGKSRFKKLHFSFLKSRVVSFKKDLFIESKTACSKKNCLLLMNLQVEIFLKSRVHCTAI